jgi:tetratricopeptide (TPR) repeat protein
VARAAVKAKQQARAKAQQPAKARARGRRRHSGGGNPNQQLFFVRLRRGQRWLYAALAVVFAITFVGVGVGSGSGGLSQLYSGMFGAGGNPVAQAQGEIKNHHAAKGYRDLATAYETKGDPTQAMTALQSYLGIRKKDASAWSELGGLELTQAQTLATQFQQAQQAAQLADPSQPFQPGGALGGAVGTNAAYQGASQAATSQSQLLSQQTQTSMNAALTDYQKATKIQPRSATAQQLLASTAETAGSYTLALKAWRKYIALAPDSPQKSQIKTRIKQLEKVVKATKSSNGLQSSSGSK